MFILLIFILFLLLFLLPFLPGIIELIKKHDAKPLFISMDYVRNPRYFGRSFKTMLHRATAGFTLGPGFREVQLSKKEEVELAHSLDVTANREVKHMLYVIGDLVSGDSAQFNKEVYVTGNADIGPNNIIQAMAGDGNVTVAGGVQFWRWLDADGDIDIGMNCNLGISVSSGGKLYLSNNCVFRRLFGMPIATGHNIISVIKNFEVSSSGNPLQHMSSYVRIKNRIIPPGKIVNRNIVFKYGVQIGHGCTFKGSIKSYGELVLEENVTVEGNVFADGDIFIGKNAKIGGHIFSQKSIHISEQAIVSRPDKIKSVIGNRSISFEKNVTIYGYVATEGNGTVL
jgi:predicted acyltransferase (DUF342 family)